MEERELKNLKQILLLKLKSHPDKRFGQNDRDSSVYLKFSLATKSGQKIYESFSDEELLSCLQEIARELGHPPAQKEVFWILQAYIKRRFGKWPYALKAAGLSSSAGRGGKSMVQIEEERRQRDALLEEVRSKALELGRLPHPVDMGYACEELKKYYSDWPSVIEAARIDGQMLNEKTVYKIKDLEPEYIALLEAIKKHAYRIGRSPAHGELDISLKRKLIERCGSWRNALYQVGLEPVTKIKPFQGIYIDYRRDENRRAHTNNLYNCLYKVLNLTEDDRARLAAVRGMYKQQGKIPMKKEVPRELRIKLQQACGSWVNVLYQIGIEPGEYYAAYREANCHEK